VSLTLVLLVVLVALVFEYINGFHDTANSIATVVATKVLSPGQAVLLAAATNLVGAIQMCVECVRGGSVRQYNGNETPRRTSKPLRSASDR